MSKYIAKKTSPRNTYDDNLLGKEIETGDIWNIRKHMVKESNTT